MSHKGPRRTLETEIATPSVSHWAKIAYRRPNSLFMTGNEKPFTVTKDGKEDAVSIDHIKTAYLENDKKHSPS